MANGQRIDEIGELQINVVNNENIPIKDARVIVRNTDNSILLELKTNESGQTEIVDLKAPPIALSLNEANTIQPYTNYNLEISAPGYETEVINDVEILPESLAIQNISMKLAPGEEDITIPPHTLYGEYPPKIPEDEIKQVSEPGEIVLSRVVIPEFVVVHDGAPNSNAKNYYVRYKDYIKNVASSEIYATWPMATIEANVLAIMSFTLNRVYTEWYRNRGYDFTITSSTAYDQKWINGRNIYESINIVVDNIFDKYLSRPGVRQPILTQYCDGKRVTCPGSMTQWGSLELGKQGLTSEEIIRYFYGDDMYVNTAEQISGVPASWPGYNLDIGASGEKVAQIQEQLDTISGVYTAIPSLSADGIYGERTKNSVRAFQKIFDLPETGIVDFATWYTISQIYVAISRIASGTTRR